MVIFHSCARLSDGIYICMSQICLTWAHSRNSSQSTGCKWGSCHMHLHMSKIFGSSPILPFPDHPWCWYIYPQDEGFAQRANPEGWPSNHQPLEKLTLLLWGFHLGFIQVIKSPEPMEQFTIFLLGFHLGFIQVIKSPGPMEQFANFY